MGKYDLGGSAISSQTVLLKPLGLNKLSRYDSVAIQVFCVTVQLCVIT